MPAPLHSSKVVIPESLREQLADFRRHLWRVKIFEAVAAGAAGLLVSFLLVYGLDRVWPTPGWVRLLILACGISLFAGFAPYWLHRWVWRQRRETQLARLIAKRYPGLGDRLLGVIELQDQEGAADTLSPRLRQAAMEAVAAETGRRRLAEALPPQRHRRLGLAAMALAGVAALIFALTPRAGFNALQRWLMPLAATERYTFTKLAAPPGYLAVAYGEAFDVALHLARDSEQRPDSASARYGQQPGLSAALENGSYRFTFPGQQDPGTVVFRIGDLRHEMRVEPVMRPAAERVGATIRPPAYLGMSGRSVDLNAGVLTVVQGAKIRIELEMSRPLAEATFGPTRAMDAMDGAVPSAETPVGGNFEIVGNNARTPWLDVGAVPFEIPCAWTDKLGLAGESGFRLRVDTLKDAEPVCYLQGIDRQKAILPEETVDFEVLAEDDFGVKTVGIEWSGQFTRPTDESPANGELQLAAGDPEERRILRPAAFSPAAFGISPQKITLRAWTEDRFPGRGRVFSEPVTLYVLTRDEHAQMLKSRFDRNITDLEDLARREQNLLDENERIERLKGEELQTGDNLKRLETQEQEEAETQRRIDQLTGNMEQLMKDAARNGDIDKQTMRKMAESLKSMQELSQQDVPDVRRKLGDAREQSNAPEKAEKDVDQAVDAQKQAVAKMRDAIDKANDANRQFEAGTFVNRLKKAAGEQNGIVASLKEGFGRMLGLPGETLDPSDIRRLEENARQQMRTASDVRWIQEDLGHYHARTRDEGFKILLDEMRQSRIDVGLEETRAGITGNQTYQAAAHARLWADKLAEWAGKLEGDKNAGGGGGGGAPDSEDEDFEFMLRVMKMIQQEQDLRARTRVLEQLRRDNAPDSIRP